MIGRRRFEASTTLAAFYPWLPQHSSWCGLSCSLMLSEDAPTDRSAPPTQIAISRGGVETSWTSAETIAPLVVAVLGFAAFAYWEAKKATLPILPLRLFTCPTVSGSHIATFTSMAGQFIVLFYVPNFLQIVRGLSIVSDVPAGWCCT